MRHIVQRFESDSARERRISGQCDYMLSATLLVSRHRHPQRRRQRRPCMSRTVAIMLALGAQHESVQTARRADGVKQLATSSKKFVYVRLMADVEKEMIFR